MEVKNGHVFRKSVLLAEFLGTAGISLAVNMSHDGNVNIPLVIYFMIMLTGGISGGHLNPAITLGVYIAQKELNKNGCYAMGIVLAQVLGALAALPVGYMLRVSYADEHGHEMLEPGINSFAPPILVNTDGKPAYGQVMLAEVIGGFFVIMAVLYAKREIGNGGDPALWVGLIGIAFYVSSDLFKGVSGGFINPATALAQNIWQNITVKLDPNHEWAMWTFEYTICYLLGPLIGGFVGGTVYNFT